MITGAPPAQDAATRVGVLATDHRILRTLVRETKHTAGVYAAIVQPGEARPGDEIALLESR